MRFGLSLSISLTIGTLVNCLGAAGEKFGWRGYILSRLVKAKVSQPLVLSGIIWVSWHMPLSERQGFTDHNTIKARRRFTRMQERG